MELGTETCWGSLPEVGVRLDTTETTGLVRSGGKGGLRGHQGKGLAAS